MTYRTRTLVLAAAAAAICAVTASAAQAGEFTAGEYPATITGVQTTKHQFVFNMGTVKCASASFTGNLAGPSNTLTLNAEYAECVTGSGNPAFINMTTCDYRLHANQTLAEDEVDGSLDIQCEEEGDGIDVEVPASGCVVRIPAQAGLNAITYTDNTAEGDYVVDINVVNLSYKQNANCGGGEGAFANGEYFGKSTMRGTHGGAPTGVIVH